MYVFPWLPKGVRGLHVSHTHKKVKLNALTGAIIVFFTMSQR